MSRPLSVVLALVSWACTILPLLAGLFWGLAMKCGDSCSTVGGWRHDPDAWQWEAMAVLGVVTFLAGAAFFFCVLFRRVFLATAAMLVGGTAVVLLFNAFSSDWIDHLDRRSGGELLLLMTAVFAPILALLLSVSPRRAG